MTKFIYKPKGKAREYADLACNLYTGCNNGCFYCFNKLTPWYHEGTYTKPQPRRGMLQGLDKQLEKESPIMQEIQLCFSCDPYPNIKFDITRYALLLFEKYGARISILTKNGKFAYRDFDIIARNNWKFGCTISMSEENRKIYEPYANSINLRINALQRAHDMGIYTWVSIEPIIDTLEALVIIANLKGIVNEFKIGKINHFPKFEKRVNWYKFLEDAEKLLQGEKYMFKKSLISMRDNK